MADEPTVVRKMPCPACRSVGRDNHGDNMAVYTDGHGYCFVCKHHIQHLEGERISESPRAVAASSSVGAGRLLKGQVLKEQHRGINPETFAKFDYRIAKLDGRIFEVANYVKDGKIVGQKLRGTPKDFMTRGTMKGAPLFGQHLWSPGGKLNRIVVTEGEIDAMSVSEAQGNKYPVVSVPSGAAGAAEAVRNNLEYLDQFDEVVFAFDSDEPGQAAAIECALVLKPGKAKIAKFPRKDPNEMLVAGESKELLDCIWQASEYRPDGILHVSEVKVETTAGTVFDYPWLPLTKSLFGRRATEICMHTSGSGMGKSTVMREMIDFDLNEGRKVGVLMLEESPSDTVNSLIGLKLNKPINKILAARELNKNRKVPIDFGDLPTLSDEEYNTALAELKAKPLYIYDHFGSLECDTLMQKLEYLAVGLSCSVIYLDHISIVVSGMESDDERKDIDILMTKIRSFVQRVKNVRLEAVCHLTKPQGTRPFEEGGQISLRDLRGSGGLYQLSDSVLAYERNQQDTDTERSNTMLVRSLKHRKHGTTGPLAALRFRQDNGRVVSVPWSYDEKGRVLFGKTGAQLFEPETTPVEDGDTPL